MDIISLGIAILPSVILGLILYFNDKYEKEEIKHIIFALLLGALSIVPIVYIENSFSSGSAFKDSFIIASTEEIIKFLLLILVLFPRKFFNEPYDGIVYAGFVSLGFATVENIFYVLEHGIFIGFIRMFSAVPAHVVFGVSMGYYAGIAKFTSKRKIFIYLAVAVVLPLLLHWIYDYFLLQKENKYLIMFSLGLVLLGVIIARRGLHLHAERSPFKNNE